MSTRRGMRLLIGAGQQHRVKLSERGGCPLQAPSLPGGAAADTRDVIPVWNQAEGADGLVHVTC